MDDNLKNSWKDTKLNSSGLTSAEIVNGRKRTALENLARRYRRFSNIALVMGVVWCPLFVSSPLLPDKWRIYFAIYASFYFLLCSIIDYSLYRGISSIDCSSMSVNEVAGKAFLYRKRHLQSMVVLFPMALIFVCWLIAVTTQEPYFIYGVIAGAVLGTAIGLRQFFEFMDDYRKLRQ